MHTHTHRIKHIFIQAFFALSGLYELHASCANVTVTSSSNQPNLQVQSIAMPPQFTDMKVDCNILADNFCATSLNVTDSTVVFDTTTAAEYTNLNSYNFLRSNRSLFPTFDNELIVTPTFVSTFSFFGASVAISGDGSIVAIGSPNFFSIQMVYMYQRLGNTWIFKQLIFPPPNTQSKSFGAVLSLSWDGSILAVGVPSITSALLNFPIPLPSVFMYELNRVNNQYELIQSIFGSNLGGFASALQLSATGQYLVVTNDYSRYVTTQVGDVVIPSVWVYERCINCFHSCTQQDQWEFQAKLTMNNTTGNPVQGAISAATNAAYQYVAISGDGNTIALGWPGIVNPSSSAVAVFKRTGSSWQQIQYIARNQQNFGTSVSLSSDGSYLAVGEKGNNPSIGDPHFVYIFVLRGTQYVQETVFTIPVSNNEVQINAPKVSLSADGTVVAIGTSVLASTIFLGSGTVAVAVRGPNNIWSMPFIRVNQNSELFGCSIACSADGAFVIAGAATYDSNRGAAFIYRPLGSFVPNDTVVTGSLCVYNRTTIDSTLRVQGNIHLNGTIVTGTAGQVTACTTNLSDQRVKTDITPLSHEDTRAQLHALEPVTFNFILRSPKGEVGQDLLRSQQAPLFEATESFPLHFSFHQDHEEQKSYGGQVGGQATSVGFIAQQIEKIFPHWVSTMPAMEEQIQLIDDGQVKMITIKPELYAYLVAALEHLVQKNNARNTSLEKPIISNK